MPKCVAIHQPNFFPWLGYFDKIRRSDCFIFLDDAQFPKTGGTWTNRVKIAMQGEAKWLTAPIERNFSGVRLVKEMRFSARPWRQDVLRSLEAAYRKARYYQEAMAILTPLVTYGEDAVAEYNIHTITQLCSHFGLATPLLRSSGLGIDAHGTERLIALTQKAGGGNYLCGGGADGYQDDAAFAEAGLTLTYQHFTPTPYPQGDNAFIPGLSVIDMLMHLGLTATASHLGGQR